KRRWTRFVLRRFSLPTAKRIQAADENARTDRDQTTDEARRRFDTQDPASSPSTRLRWIKKGPPHTNNPFLLDGCDEGHIIERHAECGPACGGSAVGPGARVDARLLVRVQLPLGGNDLSQRQSAPEGAGTDRAHQAPPAGTLGSQSGALIRVGPSEPGDRQA